jgi:pimeloyl-ACP methyl ester carboxylesterase
LTACSPEQLGNEHAVTARSSGSAASDGADLYFERRGDCPPLLLIAGGGGDCGYYAGLAEVLADEYTVLTYDRRGNSRSPVHQASQRLTMAAQSADAIAVLRANGFEHARMFGNSGGATIALDLAAHHPDVVDAVVAHEPPVPKVLPDPETVLASYDEMDRILATAGWQAAFAYFQIGIGGMPAGNPAAMNVFLEPSKVFPPGPLLDLFVRLSHNWEFMTTQEVRPFIDYLPDLDSIVRNRTRIALGVGAETYDASAVRVGQVTAERLGVECAVFPGGHTAPAEIPLAFAAALRQCLTRLDSTPQRSK